MPKFSNFLKEKPNVFADNLAHGILQVTPPLCRGLRIATFPVGELGPLPGKSWPRPLPKPFYRIINAANCYPTFIITKWRNTEDIGAVSPSSDTIKENFPTTTKQSTNTENYTLATTLLHVIKEIVSNVTAIVRLLTGEGVVSLNNIHHGPVPSYDFDFTIGKPPPTTVVPYSSPTPISFRLTDVGFCSIVVLPTVIYMAKKGVSYLGWLKYNNLTNIIVFVHSPE